MIKKKNINHWGEVRCDFLDEETHFWTVDAWKTPDDNEEGTIIAMIDDLTGRVIYLAPDAEADEQVQEVINDFLANWKPDVWASWDKTSKRVTLHMKTQNGEMIAEAEPHLDTDVASDEMYIGLLASSAPYLYMDLVSARSEGDNLSLYTWAHPWDEDYTSKDVIRKADIDEVIRFAAE